MKKVGIILFTLLSTLSSFGQQTLWSTVESNDSNAVKFIPYEDVTKEVLGFYDLYRYYYDYTGFDKENFIQYIAEDDKGIVDNWNWINDVEERTIVAIRSYIEGGSAIMVIYIDKNYINMLVFSNVYSSNPEDTYYGEIESDRIRFEKWFRTLLN